MKLITVVGARPQFIKAAAVSRALSGRDEVEELLLHTGQHYDHGMSQAFFEELGIPRPRFELEVGAATHGAMTGRMLEAIERVLLEQRPDRVLVYGDTNSTLAGALAAAKLNVPVAHVEAGLRSFNARMPEEINRILTDRISDRLFCPTGNAVGHLAAEGVSEGVFNVGDVMYDLALYYGERVRRRFDYSRWGIEEGRYTLCTLHRQENTRDPERLAAILRALRSISSQTRLVLPLHPGTSKWIEALGEPGALDGVQVIEPLSYLAMTYLEMGAEVILTDSGGVQKEAYFHGVPCVTLRDETEWVELVELGANRLAGAQTCAIVEAWRDSRTQGVTVAGRPFGDGHAAERIADLLVAEA